MDRIIIVVVRLKQSSPFEDDDDNKKRKKKEERSVRIQRTVAALFKSVKKSNNYVQQ